MEIISSQVSANLPSELIFEIFVRLPVKSIAKFKCVSKPMYAFLSDLRFIKKHLSITVLKNPNLCLKLDFRLFLVNEGEGWRRARRLVVPFAYSLERMEISGSCNGLLCLSDHIRDEDIYLYNPSTGVYRLLPSPQFDIPTNENSCFTSLGFGYNPSDDDYKVVRCLYHYDKPFIDIDSYQCESHIYSLNTNRWKKIGGIPLHISSRSAVWLENDILVWKATRGIGRTKQVLIVSFGMDREEFLEIPQPDCIYPDNIHYDIGVLNGFFCMFYQARDDYCEIWMMMEFGKRDSWTRTFAIRRPEIVKDYYMYLRPLKMLTTGEILIEVGGQAIVVYSPKDGGFRGVNLHGAPNQFIVIPYVESFISPFTG
ncbi:F-box protein CPR30-like [Tripterygium wilfordii]|uniref:F-box protein CPR30-like n=2 Tax=Tripterygium wilfordii TaxID=458696 RepID=A0A7J7CQW7_TRIWF|nr:F-box protein CPR30-like [Tripterygium wilfordii]